MFTLPDLSFKPEALEPFIDTLTMQVHHDKHHAAYVKNLNDALADLPDLSTKTEADLANLLKDLDTLPENIQTKVRNNGGGHWNHSFFWTLLSPTPSKVSPELETAINNSFESLDKFKEKFTSAALGRFGSGWVWLVKHGDKLEILDTPNQDNPIMENKTAIFGLDVWEHAYYLKYQNRRADYINAFWNIVNWSKISEIFLGQ